MYHRKKKRYLVGMKFCCASNAAIKKCQNRKKKTTLPSKFEKKLNSRKIMKIMSTLYFETPLTAKS